MSCSFPVVSTRITSAQQARTSSRPHHSPCPPKDPPVGSGPGQPHGATAMNPHDKAWAGPRRAARDGSRGPGLPRTRAGSRHPAVSFRPAQLQHVGQQPHRTGARRPYPARLEVTHRALAQFGPCCQLLLRQIRPVAARPQECTERATRRRRGAHQKVPFRLHERAGARWCASSPCRSRPHRTDRSRGADHC